jgi:hypothetical protein
LDDAAPTPQALNIKQMIVAAGSASSSPVFTKVVAVVVAFAFASATAVVAGSVAEGGVTSESGSGLG